MKYFWNIVFVALLGFGCFNLGKVVLFLQLEEELARNDFQLMLKQPSLDLEIKKLYKPIKLEEINEACQAVLDLVSSSNQEFSMKEVVEKVSTKGIKEDSIRAAFWALVKDQKVNISKEYKIYKI